MRRLDREKPVLASKLNFYLGLRLSDRLRSWSRKDEVSLQLHDNADVPKTMQQIMTNDAYARCRLGTTRPCASASPRPVSSSVLGSPCAPWSVRVPQFVGRPSSCFGFC